MLQWLIELLFGKPTQKLWSAVAYCRDGSIILHPESHLPDGSAIFSEPVERVEADAPAEIIGQAVRRVLNASRCDGKSPTDWQVHLQPLLKASGASDWSDLQHETLACTIARDKLEIQILPSRNGGANGDQRGFHPLSELRLQLQHNASDSELGEGLLRAFESCE